VSTEIAQDMDHVIHRQVSRRGQNRTPSFLMRFQWGSHLSQGHGWFNPPLRQFSPWLAQYMLRPYCVCHPVTSWVLSKLLNIWLCKQRHTIAPVV